MIKFLHLFLVFLISSCCLAHKTQKPIILFNGKNLDSWEGDTSLWRIEQGWILAAGDVSVRHSQNDFLCTRKDYKNYILDLDFKLEGDTGFVNSGVQVHSQRNKVSPLNEMVGYQVDMGRGYWASIYDETRRNSIIAKADQDIVKTILHEGDWNHYQIICSGRRIRILLNGVQTVDYTEPPNEYASQGKIGLQIHGGSRMKVSFKNIILTPLKPKHHA
ncbi:MAG: DUF1080 domain-containing protein [Bacteroidetes bacterium]|nr:MAG: DUF1080 domain-containing protein [Bacteroidota bacterium]